MMHSFSLRKLVNVLLPAGVALVTGVLLVAMPLSARAEDPLSVELKAQKVSVTNGKETFEAADKAKPGDTIEYRAAYKNKATAGIHNLKPNLPIPDGTEYVADSAKPKASEGSLDGKKFEPLPIKRKVRTAEGKEELREVPAARIRALRWTVGDLEGGATTTLVARVRVVAPK